jgi:hypothetical protein
MKHFIATCLFRVQLSLSPFANKTMPHSYKDIQIVKQGMKLISDEFFIYGKDNGIIPINENTHQLQLFVATAADLVEMLNYFRYQSPLEQERIIGELRRMIPVAAVHVSSFPDHKRLRMRELYTKMNKLKNDNEMNLLADRTQDYSNEGTKIRLFIGSDQLKI